MWSSASPAAVPPRAVSPSPSTTATAAGSRWRPARSGDQGRGARGVFRQGLSTAGVYPPPAQLTKGLQSRARTDEFFRARMHWRSAGAGLEAARHVAGRPSSAAAAVGPASSCRPPQLEVGSTGGLPRSAARAFEHRLLMTVQRSSASSPRSCWRRPGYQRSCGAWRNRFAQRLQRTSARAATADGGFGPGGAGEVSLSGDARMYR